MKIMWKSEYKKKPAEYRDVRDGVPYLLYLGESGTTWGPVRLIPQLPEGIRIEDVIGASYEALRQISEEETGYRAFVWLGEDPDKFEPLIIDQFSASIMIHVHDALSEKNQETFEALVSERGTFGMLVELTKKVYEGAWEKD